MLKTMKTTFGVIQKNKLFTILLLGLQLIFVLSLVAIVLKYNLEIGKLLLEIDSGMKNLNQGNIFEAGFSQASAVVQSFESLKSIILQAFIVLSLFYVFANGLIWSLANYVSLKNSFLRSLINYFWLSTIFFLPLIFIGFLIIKFITLRIFADVYVNFKPFIVVFGVLIALSSFVFFYSVSNLKYVKKNVKSSLLFVLKDWHRLLFAYLIVLFPILFLVYLIYFFANANLVLLGFLIILLLFFLAWNKLFLIEFRKN